MLTLTCIASHANQFKYPSYGDHHKPLSGHQNSNLLVVARRLHALVSLHRHIANHNNRSIRACDTDRSSASANARRDLEEVVVGACGSLPGLAISRDFHLRRAAVSIDNLGREPVL